MYTKAWQEEETHLATTLQVVAEEKRKTENDLGIVDGNDRLINVNDDGSDDAVVQQFVVRQKLTSLHQLRLSQRQPYFARLDFTPDEDAPVYGHIKAGEMAALYVGRWGVIQTPQYKVWVADWRSPVANLYYSGQLGRVSYEAPDGKVEGNMSLKRMLNVTDGKLESMQDTGLVGQEKFLADALSQTTTARLREVVTTIQAEQNNVIRHDPMAPLCVQGVAGSGKTTIALHRMAWMLYRLRNELAPRQLLILAPNPLFLSYISRVLPDLGVDDVRQMTFEGLCATLMGKRMPRMVKQESLEARLNMPGDERDALDGRLRLKGALGLRPELERFLKTWEEGCIPTQDVRLADTVIITAAEMRRYFLIEFRHFPLTARMEEVRKVVKKRLRVAMEHTAELVERVVEERLEKLLKTMPDNEERRQKARALFDARDERSKQLKEREKGFLKEFAALWGSMELLDVYRAFLRDMAERDPRYGDVLTYSLPILDKKQACPEDLPALLILANSLYGLKRMDVRHVVIDEAQDASPLQLKALREVFCRDGFTLVGDLCQGIYEGLHSWEDVSRQIFDKPPQVVRLSTAYRSTVEIMETAFSVIARHPVKGAGAAKPVLRHGEKPVLMTARDENERQERAERMIRGWLDEGYQGIAIITKTPNAAQALYKALCPRLPQLRLMTRGDEAFMGGVQVMDASLVKGLEFDCVLIADAEDSLYPDDDFHAKLFYVLCTRPLHRLNFLCRGKTARHLECAPIDRID